MTLFKQITIIVGTLILVMLGTVMYKNFHTANEFIQEQLYTDAQDTATSLGLSLSTVVDKSDISTMETMINTIFDSGYYEEISLVDMEGNPLYSRIQPPVVKDVPQWFIDAIDFEAPRASTRINDGWMPFAELYVKSHNGHAYFKLWTTLKEIGTLFLIIGVLALGLIYLLLKLVLNSLKKLQRQAEAISSNDFIIQEALPFTTEIRYITVVMNKMVSKVKTIFEKEAEAVRQYHELLYKDPLTGLSNRRYFIMQFTQHLASEGSESDGMLLLVSLTGMEKANTLIGHQHVDALLQEMAEMFASLADPKEHELAARINNTEFALLLKLESETEASATAQTVLDQTERIIAGSGLEDGTIGIHLGLCPYRYGDRVGELLAQADFAVSSAKQSDTSGYAFYAQKMDEGASKGKQEWMDTISSALKEKRIRLALQPVLTGEALGEVYHQEVFMRFQERDGQLHSAGYFMPVINRLELHSQIDRYVIEEAVNHLLNHGGMSHLALNVSAPFIKESSNLQWLDTQLQKLQKSQTGAQLYFELSNHDVLYNKEACLSLYRLLKSYGHRFGIDKFTGESKDFTYLQEIKPAYVKIDKSYIRDMIRHESTGLSNESLTIMIQSLDIKPIATAVESDEELDTLRSNGLAYFQGTHVAGTTLIERSPE